MRHRLPLAVLGAVVICVALPASSAAVTYEFPPGETGYHTFLEMVDEIHDVEAAHPSIVDVFPIGTSAKGRTLWAAKISDDVATDEAEPEVLLEGGTHGDEHMGTELAIATLHWLVDGYGSNTRITSIVDSREIFIVFIVNPDGATYNITNRVYQDWRKNRQPNAGSSAIGTDLNRNYGYRWGCCGGASTNKADSRYRGAAAFSAPETKAVRDFVDSRVIGGRQQIRVSASFHTTGRLIGWPYSYTTTNVPSDMTAADQAGFVAMAGVMASSSGYKPQQAGDRYIHSGTAIDWFYGIHRIKAFLFELEPDSSLYLPDEKIATETARNKNAVLYLIEQAGCPWKESGKADQNCGPMYEDFEGSTGWATETGTADRGAFGRANPAAVSWNGAKQLDATASGSYALVTGAAAGTSHGAFDVDGVTRIVSPPVLLPAGAGPLSFRYVFAHGPDPRAADWLRVYVEDVGTGDRTRVWEKRGTAADVDAAWASGSVSIASFAGATIRIVIEARDGGADSGVEAAIDDLRIERGTVPLP